nr:MAG TPA: hypothetical protein [Caudoviricetes sp.]
MDKGRADHVRKGAEQTAWRTKITMRRWQNCTRRWNC